MGKKIYPAFEINLTRYKQLLSQTHQSHCTHLNESVIHFSPAYAAATRFLKPCHPAGRTQVSGSLLAGHLVTPLQLWQGNFFKVLFPWAPQTSGKFWKTWLWHTLPLLKKNFCELSHLNSRFQCNCSAARAGGMLTTTAAQSQRETFCHHLCAHFAAKDCVWQWWGSSTSTFKSRSEFTLRVPCKPSSGYWHKSRAIPMGLMNSQCWS